MYIVLFIKLTSASMTNIVLRDGPFDFLGGGGGGVELGFFL